MYTSSRRLVDVGVPAGDLWSAYIYPVTKIIPAKINRHLVLRLRRLGQTKAPSCGVLKIRTRYPDLNMNYKTLKPTRLGRE